MHIALEGLRSPYKVALAGVIGFVIMKGTGDAARSPEGCSYGAVHPSLIGMEAKIEEKIRREDEVQYDANRSVDCGRYNTAVPIKYSLHEQDYWFALTGEVNNPQVKQIVNPKRVRKENWISNPGEDAYTSSGVVQTDTETDIPAVKLYLTDYSSRLAAIGHTAAR